MYQHSFIHELDPSVKVRFKAIKTVQEALDLDLLLASKLDSTNEDDYQLIVGIISSYILEAWIEDDLGTVLYTELEDSQKQEFLEAYLSTPYLVKRMVEAILEGSGLSQELKGKVHRRFEIQYEDHCECPICQPNSNGNYVDNTPENREEFGCLLHDLGGTASRISYYAMLLGSSSQDWLQAPYYLFEAYQIMMNVQMISEGKKNKERKAEKKARDIKKRKEELDEKRFGSTNTNTRSQRRR